LAQFRFATQFSQAFISPLLGRYVAKDSLVKKSNLFIVAMIAFYGVYQLYNWQIYKNIEVTSYSDLMNKAKYGQITHKDLRNGAFDLIENSLCIMINEDLTFKCISEFQSTKEKCASDIFDKKDLKGFDETQASVLVRLFNVCRQSTLN